MKPFTECTLNFKKSRNAAFTLIELLVGIAVSTILLLGLFQLLADLSLLQMKYEQQSRESHQQASLVRIMNQDLTSLPKSEPDFVGRKREFIRTTVAYHPEKNHRLETRIRYYTRSREDGKTALLRQSKWVDLQDDFDQPRVLLEATSIDFSYRTVNNVEVQKNAGVDSRIGTVIIQMADKSLSFPISHRSDDDEENQQKPSPTTS